MTEEEERKVRAAIFRSRFYGRRRYSESDPDFRDAVNLVYEYPAYFGVHRRNVRPAYDECILWLTGYEAVNADLGLRKRLNGWIGYQEAMDHMAGTGCRYAFVGWHRYFYIRDLAKEAARLRIAKAMQLAREQEEEMERARWQVVRQLIEECRQTVRELR